MSKFQVGDRVVVYGSAGKHPRGGDSPLFLYGAKGCVIEAVVDCVMVALDAKEFVRSTGHKVEVHDKQCRKLVRRPRRRVFISERLLKKIETDTVSDAEFNVSLERCVTDDVEFVEVRRKAK